ncbi:Male sterility C-terminal domain protein [Indibacter alkaliphilus LW1]|jgi:hypothetical protein|uniref:Male sterility C-terminal domain protein n=1 Tax=Indibacter alkaliphilus (strain CCUG 57479 / KCTC 22604 / LW1) TaxID=1189612 RepID=S2CZF8_INDAL|nr:DUF2867 domain-containing protein [Indibacter alkaliphilus]EOZ91999.1 Male sterility C-terminal domain protein [Indibacter alkaliphilus LW1]
MDNDTEEIHENFKFRFQNSPKIVWDRVLNIGGKTGWYYGTKLWKLRGFIDKIFGGTGYRKGKKSPDELQIGDQIDFWRIIYLDKESMKIGLEAEMKLPGKVQLFWSVGENFLLQKIHFDPKGKMGKAYWYLVRPFHYWIFWNMGKNVAQGS